VLQELCEYRDQMARSLDRPLFKVINNSALYNIAEACPRSMRELEAVQGISHKQARWLGRGILTAVHRGLKVDQPPKFPRKPRPSDAYLLRVDKLRQWRKNKGRAMGVESDVVLPKDLLYEFAEANPQSLEQVSGMLEAGPWRREQFGYEIFQLLNPSAAKRRS
jgi:ribonuclease D